jgi:hypothetical protein
MNSYARDLPATRTIARRRAQTVSLLGPVTIAAGLVWGILQPDRLTLLNPGGQGVWWLLIEPPLLVAVAGIIFALVVARPLLADLERHRATTR